ncbi:hypothetical protein Dalk_2511 [Desulfatibacillum aliphaticivorans]|uniref:Uncharacterized protein n=1 Tax=Desulfatibacillum aliphaticivorans TaxID=218208 RepID=B8FFE4_DESAL|nr:hypothetical protein Dalk_2511 [Desulfatibacillum aliphaticivorans]
MWNNTLNQRPENAIGSEKIRLSLAFIKIFLGGGKEVLAYVMISFMNPLPTNTNGAPFEKYLVSALG